VSDVPWHHRQAAVWREPPLALRRVFRARRGRLAPLVQDGLVLDEATRILVASRGRLLLRIIVMCFDVYLDDTAPGARYSPVI
jgi:oxygen-independent coproporphyrinogen-3 oxidase